MMIPIEKGLAAAAAACKARRRNAEAQSRVVGVGMAAWL
jgi:hypothetical protein